MNLMKTSRIAAVVFALLVFAIPMHAGKRRAVKHGSSGIASVSGTVLDNVTGQPVRSAKVSIGRKSDTTDAAGKYTLKNIAVTATTVIEVERSGYATKSVPFSATGTQVVDFRLDPTATVTVQTTDGVTRQIDFDSLKFGYVLPFAGYVSDEAEDFCKSDGTLDNVDRSEMKKLVGPATRSVGNACCTSGGIEKIRLELKSGETTDAYFTDSCNGYDIQLIGRNHVTGEYEYLYFARSDDTDAKPHPGITEVIFP